MADLQVIKRGGNRAPDDTRILDPTVRIQARHSAEDGVPGEDQSVARPNADGRLFELADVEEHDAMVDATPKDTGSSAADYVRALRRERDDLLRFHVSNRERPLLTARVAEAKLVPRAQASE